MNLCRLKLIVPAAVAGFLPVVAAQSPSETATPAPAGQPAGLTVPEAVAGGSPILDELSFDQITLPDAADYMRGRLEEVGLKPNIVLAPGSEKAGPVTLRLRNVRVLDALQLIAAQAGCYLEVVTSWEEGQSEEVVAYKFIAEDVDEFALAPPAAPVSPQPPPPNPAPAAPPVPAGVAAPMPVGGVGMARPGWTPVGGSGTGVYGTMAGRMSGNDESQQATRIYPLGGISLAGDFATLEKVVADVLQTDGVPPDQVKLSYHEAARILILRGPERAQSLVQSVLTSLSTNEASVERQSSDVMRLEMESQLQRNIQQRLESQIAELTRDNLELTRENALLKNSIAEQMSGAGEGRDGNRLEPEHKDK